MELQRQMFFPIVYALRAVATGLRELTREVISMVDKLQKLQDAVGRLETREASAITLLRGLAQLVRDLKNATDIQAEADALADRIDAKSAELAAAVDENTNVAQPDPVPVDTGGSTPPADSTPPSDASSTDAASDGTATADTSSASSGEVSPPETP